MKLGIDIGERQIGVTRNLISRWERGQTEPRAPYPKLLCLLFKTTAEQLGLVASSPPPRVSLEDGTIEDELERREFLNLFYSAARAATALAVLPPGLRSGLAPSSTAPTDAPHLHERGAWEGLEEHPYRRLWASTPSPTLVSPALAHLNLVSQILGSSGSKAERTKLAAAVSQAAEFVGWLAYDTGDHTNGSRQYQRAMLYAEQSGNDHLRAHLMAQMSLWAGLFGDGERALRLIAQAMSLVPSGGLPTARAWLSAREAAAYSRIGDKRAALEAVSRSEAAAEQARPGEEPWPWVFPFDDARIGMYRGTIATILKLPKVALPALEQGMDGLKPAAAQPHELSQRSAEEGPKLRALVLCDLAESYVASGEIEESCKLILEALPIGIQMGSDRVLRRFGEIRKELAPSKDVRAVKELDERLLAEFFAGVRGNN